MKNKIYLIVIILTLVPFILNAEQITTVGIIDIAKIYDAFPNKSFGYASINRLKEEYQKEIDNLVKDLDVLKRERLKALEESDYEKAKNLDNTINNKANYIEALTKQRQSDLIRKSKTPVSSEFIDKLQEAISYVSEERGYTLVLQSNIDGLQWWAPVIDITNDVIQRLKTTL